MALTNTIPTAWRSPEIFQLFGSITLADSTLKQEEYNIYKCEHCDSKTIISRKHTGVIRCESCGSSQVNKSR